MEALTNLETSIQMIDENGDIEFSITEENHDKLEAFTVKARRKRLRTLKYIAAFNIARHLDCRGDLKYLNLPMTLKPLVNKFIISYSGDYILDMS